MEKFSKFEKIKNFEFISVSYSIFHAEFEFAFGILRRPSVPEIPSKKLEKLINLGQKMTLAQFWQRIRIRLEKLTN